ncbi:MAG TPA: hypothetical protein VI912_02355 [Candidatus Bilamarchaeaceae archaeon]|nr:hypothetical protein [Candidatus Bilamarchaeaceae archaeon]
MEIIKVPDERIQVLKKAKQRIEQICKIKISINEESEVSIDGEESEVYFAKDVIRAIGRGFDPKIATRIITKDLQFVLLNLKEYLRNENAIGRMKARVIGDKGKIKKDIEDATDSYLCVYGNTIGIISKIDSIEYAREAIELILRGARFTSLFTYLSKIKRKMFADRLSLQRA